MRLKAIETNYRGVRFRSRIEARWAIVFDTLKVKFEYEAEGFELPSGRYLPDFNLGPGALFFEVKGAPPTPNEIRIACELAEAEHTSVLIAHSGFNWDEASKSYSPRICACWGMSLSFKGGSPPTPIYAHDLMLCGCVECGAIAAAPSVDALYCRRHPQSTCTGKHDLRTSERIQYAYRKAVGTRFEFDERK